MKFVKYILAYFNNQNHLEQTELGDFDDIEKESWYATYAETVIKAGIMKGYKKGKWKPNEFITRAELAKIIIGSALKIEEIKTIHKTKNK